MFKLLTTVLALVAAATALPREYEVEGAEVRGAGEIGINAGPTTPAGFNMYVYNLQQKSLSL